MRIVYVANNRLPTEKAHGLQIVQMCDAFASLGHDVTLVLPNRKNPITEDIFTYYDLERRFKVVTIPVIDAVGFGKIGFFLTASMFTKFASLRYLFKKIDLFFTRDEIVAASLGLLGKKVIWESHTGSYNIFAKIACRFASRIVVITKGLKDFYVSKDVPAEKITIAHDAVNIEDFTLLENQQECRTKLALPENKKIIVYTGHLYEWKGVYTLAEASSQLPEDFLVVFVGGTARDIQLFTDHYGDVSTIRIEGHKNHSQIPYYLKAADAVVLPNSAKTELSSVFTSPMKLFEYMASGTLIITSDVPAIREILDESSAVFFKADDVVSLRGTLLTSLRDVDSVGRLAKISQKLALKYTWQSRAEQITQLI